MRSTPLGVVAWLACALLLPARTALAQTPRPDGPRAAALLERCTDEPDRNACRAALRFRLSPGDRSLALTYLADAEEERPDTLLQAALRLDPGNALAHYLLGHAAVGKGARLRELQAALALRPDWTFIYREQAVLAQQGTTAGSDTVIAAWRRDVQVEPDAADAWVELGDALYTAERLPEAESAYARAAALEAERPEAVAGLCLARLKQGKTAEAQAPCVRAIQGWNGRHGMELDYMSSLAEDHNDYPLALAATERGLTEGSGAVNHLLVRSRVLAKLGRAAEGDSLLRAFAASHRDDWLTVELIAEQIYAGGDLGTARTLYRGLLSNPCTRSHRSCTIEGGLALASLRLGLVDEAFEALDQSLTQQPDCPDMLASFRTYARARPDSAALLARLHRMVDQVGARVATGDPATAGDFFASIPDWPHAARFYGIALDSARARAQRKEPVGRFGLEWEYGRALVELGRYCEALAALTAGQAAEPMFSNGRPSLAQALQRARAECKEPR